MCCSFQLFFFISSPLPFPFPFSLSLFFGTKFLYRCLSFHSTRLLRSCSYPYRWLVHMSAFFDCMFIVYIYIYIYMYVISLFYPACGRPKDLWGVPWDVPFGQGRYNQAAIVWCDDAWLPRDSRRFFPKARHDGSNVSCFIGEELFFFFLLFYTFYFVNTHVPLLLRLHVLPSVVWFIYIDRLLHSYTAVFFDLKKHSSLITFLHYLVLS